MFTKKLRNFVRKTAPFFGVFAVILTLLLVLHSNGFSIFSETFLAQLRLPGTGATKLAGAELAKTVTGGKTGLPAIYYFVFSVGYKTITQVIGAVAVLVLVYFGIQMIVSNSQEERISKAKSSILMIFIGLAIVAVADFVVKEVFVLQGGTFIGDTTVDGKSISVMQQSALKFNEQVHLFVTFLRYIIQGIAFFFIVRSGLGLIVGGQESDVLDKTKKAFMWGIVALVIVMAAETVIKKVVFPIDVGDKQIVIGEVQIQAGQSIIAQIVNMILAFAGGVAVVSLIAGAAMYAMAIGHEQSTEKGKKMVIGSLMGLVIIYSAYTIISEFIR